MSAGHYDFAIEQGATLSKSIQVLNADDQPIDLTQAQPRLQARADYGTDLLLDCNPTNGKLTVANAAQGLLLLTVSAAETALMVWSSAVYDLEIEYQGGAVQRLLQGRISISREVTTP